MPQTKLTSNQRHALILEALSGVSAIKVARRYDVRRQHVHRLVKDAKENAAREFAYWQKVCRLL